MPSSQVLLQIIYIGIGATAILDAWILFLNHLGVKTLNFALMGRWLGHILRGKIMHASITQATPISYEMALGCLLHYAVGIAFSALLAGIVGLPWLHHPSIWHGLIMGICSVAAPFCVMQPAMGLGFAASKTPNPLQSRMRSLGNHMVFGMGLYVSAALFN